MAIFGKFHGPDFLSFLEYNRLRSHMDQVLGSVLAPVRRRYETFKDFYVGVYPHVNLYETDEAVLITAELPGVKAEDLEISIKNDNLTLAGEKKIAERPEEANFYRKERLAGTFRKSVALPVKVDSEKSEAKLKNGILTITIPKAAEAKARTISIKSE
jgi:HSP20 family protein